MIEAQLSSETAFDEWRDAARGLCASRAAPETVIWRPPSGEGALFSEPRADPSNLRAVTAPTAFVEAARRVVCHRDPLRFARLYRLLWRLQDEPRLLANAVDDDVLWLRDRDKAVRRDEHKMHAFVRFRAAGVSEQGRERYAAWFEPEHRIVELTADFFVRRFTGMDWAIVTPERSALWSGGDLAFAAGGRRDDVPAEDAMEAHWRSYYASIFNPARLKLKAMRQHMPKRYWRNLPEAELIPSLTAGAEARAEHMRRFAVTERNALADKVRPAGVEEGGEVASLAALKPAVDRCRRCPLYKDATQGVAGEGPPKARLMIVGEQPGDQEDLTGHPFVGPAGQLLDRAMIEAGIDRTKAFVTNAVKHFKFEQRGKRRIHAKPSAGEIDVCRYWLDVERSFVRPKVILGLGATAARGLLGKSASIASLRGVDHVSGDARVRITVHPSYLLRLPDPDARAREYVRFVEDLRVAGELAQLQ
jgi:uracil-DNA glycosylase